MREENNLNAKYSNFLNKIDVNYQLFPKKIKLSSLHKTINSRFTFSLVLRLRRNRRVGCRSNVGWLGPMWHGVGG